MSNELRPCWTCGSKTTRCTRKHCNLRPIEDALQTRIRKLEKEREGHILVPIYDYARLKASYDQAHSEGANLGYANAQADYENQPPCASCAALHEELSLRDEEIYLLNEEIWALKERLNARDIVGVEQAQEIIKKDELIEAIKHYKREICPSCQGLGSIYERGNIEDCLRCDGEGTIEVEVKTIG